MGKRSDFERRERDFYPTPAKAVEPLIPHLRGVRRFVEPCAGDGALIRHLEGHGYDCTFASDIEAEDGILQKNALNLNLLDTQGSDAVITNPPWERNMLHAMIEHFRSLRTTWLLFDADWAHTNQAIPYLKNCAKIIAVGRVKWIPGSPHTGKDNCAWYKFVPGQTSLPTEFYGRV